MGIINHPLMTNRWGTSNGFDDVPVNFMPMLQHLHRAGFNIITYDQRGQGESDGDLVGVGSLEWQDFAGVLKYVSKHSKFSKMKLGFVTQCMGAVASFKAWKNAPEAFDLAKVKAHVAIQPVISYNMTNRVTQDRVGIGLASEVEESQKATYGFGFPNVIEDVASVKVPMFFMQMKGDYTQQSKGGINDAQLIADAAQTQREFLWIGPNTTNPWKKGRRFDAYNYFGKHPKALIKFLSKNME